MKKYKGYCFALDLKDDKELIEEYIGYHKKVPAVIIDSIKSSGIEEMQIYNVSNRLFMIIKTNEMFSFEAKQKADDNNQHVQEWETLMWKFQQALPISKPGEKWVLMQEIFKLE